MGNDFCRPTVLLNSSAYTNGFFRIVTLRCAELRPVASPDQDREDLVRIWLVEVQECWLAPARCGEMSAGNNSADGCVFAEVAFCLLRCVGVLSSELDCGQKNKNSDTFGTTLSCYLLLTDHCHGHPHYTRPMYARGLTIGEQKPLRGRRRQDNLMKRTMRDSTTDTRLEVCSLVRRFGEKVAKAAGDMPVLDVACGSGRNAIFLRQLGCTVICMDNDLSRLHTE